ncbi:MAG: transporter [Gammaproteobacteria bacterium]
MSNTDKRFANPISVGIVAAGLSLLPATPVLACAACGCSLSTDAAMGYTAAAGWRVSLQYDYIDQSQLRHGMGSVSPASVAALNPTADQEVEKDTTNRYITLGLTYAPSTVWNFRLLVPYVDRGHTTYGAETPPLIQFGLKLPTGHYGGPDASGTGVVGSHPVAFASGPAAGELLDTSLQAGTGSTDVVVGGYYYKAVSQNFDAFINGQFQAAVAHRLDQSGANFRPGNLITLSTGLRYEKSPRVVPQLQLNISRKSADQGALADTANTAGTTVYLSPGVSVAVTRSLQAYGFVQLPVYSRLDGYQLFPKWTATVGVSYGF